MVISKASLRRNGNATPRNATSTRFVLARRMSEEVGVFDAFETSSLMRNVRVHLLAQSDFCISIRLYYIQSEHICPKSILRSLYHPSSAYVQATFHSKHVNKNKRNVGWMQDCEDRTWDSVGVVPVDPNNAENLAGRVLGREGWCGNQMPDRHLAERSGVRDYPSQRYASFIRAGDAI